MTYFRVFSSSDNAISSLLSKAGINATIQDQAIALNGIQNSEIPEIDPLTPGRDKAHLILQEAGHKSIVSQCNGIVYWIDTDSNSKKTEWMRLKRRIQEETGAVIDNLLDHDVDADSVLRYVEFLSETGDRLEAGDVVYNEAPYHEIKVIKSLESILSDYRKDYPALGKISPNWERILDGIPHSRNGSKLFGAEFADKENIRLSAQKAVERLLPDSWQGLEIFKFPQL